MQKRVVGKCGNRRKSKGRGSFKSIRSKSGRDYYNRLFLGRNRFCIKTNGQTDAIVTIPYWVALLVSVLLFGMASIGVIITENPRDMVESVDESVKVDIEAITSFQTNISRIADMCEEPGLKAELEKLREQLRYADPVSSERTREIEADIETALTGLKELVNDGNTDDAKSLIKKITVALNERNRICKVSKV